MMFSHSPPWYADSLLTNSVLSELGRDLAQVRFGAPWPDSIRDRYDCDTFRGSSYSFAPEEYWVYRCRGKSPGGIRTDFIYSVPGRKQPTLERVRYTLSAPARAPVEQWRRIKSMLLDTLPLHVGSVDWLNRDPRAEGLTENGTVEVELLGAPGQATVDSLVVEYRSNWLVGQAGPGEWENSDADFEEMMKNRMREVISELRSHRSSLATALESTRASPDQLRAVRSELMRASSHATKPAERDLLLLAVHMWSSRLAGTLQSKQGGCARGDTTIVHEFNTVFAPERGRIDCVYDDSWCYSGTWLDSLATRAGKDRWADYAFLERMYQGWSPVCGFCGHDSNVGTDLFRPVIKRGERFLDQFPASWIAPDVKLMVAEAHETAWSLAKTQRMDEYIDWTRYTLDASGHRIRAIELYDAYLRERPADPRGGGIRLRLGRLRIDSDTSFHKYWCLWD